MTNTPEKSDLTTFKSSKGNDLFYLNQVFPDAQSVFQHRAKHLTELNEDCLFVLDANVLLDTHLFGKKSINKIREIFSNLKKENRIFIPAMVAREYARHRQDRLIKVYDQIYNEISGLPGIDDVKSVPNLNVPMLEHMKEYAELLKSREKCKELRNNYSKEVENFKSILIKIRDQLVNWDWKDQVSDLFANTFDRENIIDCEEPGKAIQADLDWRIRHSIPPGFKDKGKIDDGVGDLIIWKTILQIGEIEKKNIVFVSNDVKLDWTIKAQDASLGAREELTYEFYSRCHCHFQMVNYESFLEIRGAEDEVIGQAKHINDSRLHSQITEFNIDDLATGLELLSYCKKIQKLPKDTQQFIDVMTSNQFRHAVLKMNGLINRIRNSDAGELIDDVRLSVAQISLQKILFNIKELSAQEIEDMANSVAFEKIMIAVQQDLFRSEVIVQEINLVLRRVLTNKE
ncbi:hypothetical protein Pla110_44200 [Polystyrenella longa]|uniref:PIN like domain-containing protein n=1 Tax=Polystyrenella longa TaxID=2528007 RepID=A0A518CTV2_9PLAN|nr:PIN domain-containing protein [Polystyrenella longa]QDU82659.1 hypothetical protein Pla110_44200 [Polystyrenella longa]